MTKFEDLFDLFLDTEINSFDLSRYSPPRLAKYLSNLLKRARGECYNLVYSSDISGLSNKMTNCVDFSYNDYSFSFIGVTFNQVLNPTPTSNNFYITVNGASTTNFSYDSILGIITINGLSNTIVNNIEITSYENGHFNDDLTLIEQEIMVGWMGCIYLKDKVKEERLTKIAIYGKDYSQKSQGNHLMALEKTYRDNRKEMEEKTYEYTYRNNPNGFSGFGGRGGIRRVGV